MKCNFKKYPLLVCLIVSAVIIVASLFVTGFAGLKFDSTIVGGSQVEVVLPDDANTQDYANDARIICQQTGLSLYGVIVEDKYTAGAENGEYTKRVMILTFAEREVSEEKQLEYRKELAEKLGFADIQNISEFRQVTNMVESKNIWFVVLSLVVVMACGFVFAWIRYDVLAAISFALAYLHNIMICFAVSAICRLPIGLTALSIMVVLTFIMSAVVVHIFEEYRKVAKLHIDDNQTTAERMINSEKKILMPYVVIAGTVVIVSLMLLLSPAFMVRLAAISILACLIVCAYTAILVVPGLYAYLIDLRNSIQKANLSRNDTKNKTIKKKIAKAKKSK